jgi:tetratricopeptide (TPR) repeat protein
LLAARAYIAAGNIDRAEPVLKTVIEADPSNVPAYGLLGQLYVSQRRLEDALKEYEQLAGRQARPVGAYSMAGVLLEALGRPEEARKRYQAALDLDPAAALAANNLAFMTAESGGSLDAALQLAQTAKRGMPDQPQVDDTLGWVYLKKGMTTMALPLLENAAKQMPGNAAYHYHLAMAYSNLGDSSRAEASLALARKLNPEYVQAAEAKRTASLNGPPKK